MKHARLFVAIAIPPKVQHELHRMQKTVRSSGIVEGTYPLPETSHITLQFIGSVAEQQIDAIIQALQSIQFPSFEITINRLDYFEHHGSPAVLYLNIESPEMHQLAQKINYVLQPYLPKEERPFVGHLTIMRIKKITDPQIFLDLLNTIPIIPLSFMMNSFSLMQSVLSNEGPLYKEITFFPLVLR